MHLTDYLKYDLIYKFNQIKDKKLRENRKDARIKENSLKESKSLKFNPSINHSLSDDKSSFFERQEEFVKIKSNNFSKLSHQLETSFSKKFTFEPKINKTSNNKERNKENVVNRLYM